MKISRTLAASAAAALMATAAFAECDIENGRVNILANDFPALRAITETAAECAGDGVTVEANHNKDFRTFHVQALTPNPAEYTSVIVANSSIVPLMNEGLLRPLDDLVEKYGQDLARNQLITINGQVMAIAFMANAQHLFVRQDILDEVGKPVPTTWEEVVETGQAIKDAGIMDHPFAFLSMSDWNLGEEFVNMYLGHGGEFFKPGTAEPSINNETGVATLNMMKELVSLSNPDFLTYNTATVVPIWKSGNLAIAQLWGSSGGELVGGEGSEPGVAENTVLAAAPSVGGGSTPSSTLWWDGFTIAKNVSDEDAEATFKAMVHGISDKMVEANNDAAVWLMESYKPGPAAVGVAATAQAGAKPYPMLPYMGLLHQAFQEELPDFLQGSESAEQTLQDIEAAYTTAAREAGFL
ncbi:extracellular solute-binding protein [Sulfitobacter sp. D35]|uniref:ABC transporter substrate-binding protein n=1 Tax=Sulfitobacter sp. D35 TaxID=3083252 RepID=UPI00296F524C|nr:extracellular solute-binding protein [Sulfitobacter sp. D35]MDW4499317.1 extracellular solute-binding protein [Sulfitobacter sp. D35]